MLKVIRQTVTAGLLATIAWGSAFANEDFNAPETTKVDEYTLKGPVNYVSDVDVGDAAGNVNVVIEIPKGTMGKWEVVEDGTIKWEFKNGKPRTVDYMGGYPANYGSVPKTAMPKSYGGDGESIDVVVMGEPIARGSVVQVKLVGVLNLKEEDEFDAKLLAVRVGSPEAEAASIDELNQKFGGIVNTVADWFSNYKGADAGIKIESIGDAALANEILTVSVEAFGK